MLHRYDYYLAVANVPAAPSGPNDAFEDWFVDFTTIDPEKINFCTSLKFHNIEQNKDVKWLQKKIL